MTLNSQKKNTKHVNCAVHTGLTNYFIQKVDSHSTDYNLIKSANKCLKVVFISTLLLQLRKVDVQLL